MTKPTIGVLLATLGLIDAGLSRKAEALAEGRRAVELRPICDDALDGSAVIANLAMIYAWVGDVDSAIERRPRLRSTQVRSCLARGPRRCAVREDRKRASTRLKRKFSANSLDPSYQQSTHCRSGQQHRG
jgi:hypothetical protein